MGLRPLLRDSDRRRRADGLSCGRFEPDAAAADAILDWVSAYAASEDGTVRHARWPAGMKGHFIARIPAKGGDNR